MATIQIKIEGDNVTIDVKKSSNRSFSNKIHPIEIEIENVKENVLCPICLIAKVNTVLECTHVLCSNCVKK